MLRNKGDLLKRFSYLSLPVCEYFALMLACAPDACTTRAPEACREVRRGRWIPWNWSDRWLWVAMWVLGTEDRSSARATKCSSPPSHLSSPAKETFHASLLPEVHPGIFIPWFKEDQRASLHVCIHPHIDLSFLLPICPIFKDICYVWGTVSGIWDISVNHQIQTLFSWKPYILMETLHPDGSG